MSAERIVMRVVQETGEIVETPLTDDELKLNWNRSVCAYCGVGCGILVGSQDGRVKKVRGDPNHPANYGLLCGKGATLPLMVHTPDRLTAPLLRTSRNRSHEPVGWDEALSHIADRWRAIIDRHGPDSVAFYISGQMYTEDYYVVNKLAKGFLGTNNVDSNSRLCMASAVSGYVTSLGADAPPGCYADIELADCFFLIGTNTAACHPVTFERIRRRKLRAPNRIKAIVADPRRTRTADIADVYLPIRPGTDVALLNAMLYVLIEEGLTDKRFIERHTAEWQTVQERVKAYPPERAAAICGVPADDIRRAAMLFGKAHAALSFWSMGLNQSTQGTAKNNSVINLHLATGQIGRAGAGPFSLTGQPNAMGGRETGGLAHLLPGHRFIANAQDRAETESLWGVPPGRIGAKPGLNAVDLFKELDEGRVKSVWILCTNPMVSMPNVNRVRRALEKAELVIINDIYHPTETTRMADVILPAAQWAERNGTVTNSERCVSYAEKAIEPPGIALPDWEIICRFARHYGFAEAFAFETAEQIYEEYKTFTSGRDLDVSGITYDRLKQSPLHWPCPTDGHRSTLRRFTDGKFAHADQKARFLVHDYADPAEKTDADFPMVLTTGRVRDQWHTLTRTGKIPVLAKKEPGPFLEVHARDAAGLGLCTGELVTVRSRRGQATAACRVTEAITPGTCFMPFHWGALWGDAAINQATSDAYDPLSKQPELKFCAVRLEKAAPHAP